MPWSTCSRLICPRFAVFESSTQMLAPAAAVSVHFQLSAACHRNSHTLHHGCICCYSSSADAVACSTQVVNLTQALISEFNRTL